MTAVLFISISGENCEVCRPPFIFYNGKCVSSCPSTKYFPDIRHKRCELCHPGCSRCYGPNKWDCMECRGNYTLVEGTCVLHCDAASYADDMMGKCQPCNEICKTCSGPTQYNCTSCGNGTYHDTESNTCVEKCTEGYYGQDATCYSCHHTCIACKSAGENSCLSCFEPRFRFNSSCIKSCPSGTYMAKIGNYTVCRPCSNACVSCMGPSDANCTSCPTAMYLQTGRCLSECSEGFVKDFATKTCILIEEVLKPTARSLKALKNSDSNLGAEEKSTTSQRSPFLIILLLISLGILVSFLIYLRIRSRINKIKPYQNDVHVDCLEDTEWTDKSRKMSMR